MRMHADVSARLAQEIHAMCTQVQEAFVKIREQARAHLDRPNELMAGYNLLATTNLDYFGVSQWRRGCVVIFADHLFVLGRRVCGAFSASHHPLQCVTPCHTLHPCLQPQHQAEIYRLKGAILSALKDMDAAHNCFSTSLHLWRTAAEAWVAWGALCDEQWESRWEPSAAAPPLRPDAAIYFSLS
jgi:transformation/transcription domain-associated protein